MTAQRPAPAALKGFGKGDLLPCILAPWPRFLDGAGAFFICVHVCYHVGMNMAKDHRKPSGRVILPWRRWKYSSEMAAVAKEEGTHLQGLGVYLARTDGDGGMAAISRAADDRAMALLYDLTRPDTWRAAVVDTGDLRQSSADDTHRCADKQLRQVEPPRWEVPKHRPRNQSPPLIRKFGRPTIKAYRNQHNFLSLNFRGRGNDRTGNGLLHPVFCAKIGCVGVISGTWMAKSPYSPLKIHILDAPSSK